MKNHMHLVQRGSFRPCTSINDFKGLTGREGFIDLDYMGSAEFEWGTIPKAYRRIMNDFNDYHTFVSDIVNFNGVPLNIWCKKGTEQEIVECLKKYIEKPYSMKEGMRFEDHLKAPHRSEFNGKSKIMFPCNTNFWWEVEIGMDFMLFFGAKDRINQFEKIIHKDYTDWWMEKSPEKRQEDYEESIRNVY